MDKLKDRRPWFGTESDPDDRRNQNEDLGDNSMAASAYGIKNLKRTIAEESNAYTAAEMMADLKKGIWNELSTKQSIDIYRRNLQKVFVERLIRLANPEPVTATTVILGAGSSANNRTNDVISIAKMGLRSLQTEIRGALPIYKDAMSRAHLQDVNDRITAALDPK